MKKSLVYSIFYLLLIVSGQYIVRYFIIKPGYDVLGIPLQMSGGLFLLMVLAVLSIAVAGFFIADYYNNKQMTPFPQGVEQKTDARYTAFLILSIIGCGLGIFIGWKIKFLNLGILFIIYATVLYFYALRYRLLTFWGNFIVALLTALLILNVWLFEFFALRNHPEEFGILIRQGVFSMINTSILYYAGFYFILIFGQQIVKDILLSPQAPSGSNTFPIRFGIIKTKNILAIVIICLMIISCLFFVVPLVLSKQFSYSFIAGVFIILIEFFLLLKVLKSSSIENFKPVEYLFDTLIILGMLALIVP